MMECIGDIIIIGMLLFLAIISVLLIHQVKMIIIEDREFKTFLRELQNGH